MGTDAYSPTWQTELGWIFTACEQKQVLVPDCSPDILMVGLGNHYRDSAIRQAKKRQTYSITYC